MYNRVLFGLASAWNLAVAGMLLIRPETMLERLGIGDPAARLLARSFFSSVATWGLAYALVAYNPRRFRDFAWLGVLSKLLFFSIYAVAWCRGSMALTAFVPAVADLILALLFLEFLRRTKPRESE